MVYISTSYLTKENLKMAADKWDKEIGLGEGHLIINENETTCITEITSDLKISVDSESEIGHISIDVKLDDEALIEILGLILKKFERYKQALKSLKEIE